MGLSAISTATRHLANPKTGLPASARASESAEAGAAPKTPATANGQDAAQSKLTLSAEALALIGKLKARDTQVRQHEAAHLAAAGGQATSGASYTYQKGPDGVSYAIGGEVGIDLSPGRTPSETIARARQVQAAALAPADPSGQDVAVAAKAQQMEQKAQADLAQQQQKTSVARAYGTSQSANLSQLSVFA